ncbi:hypothetical protein D3C87_334890 [compost metagenome]
MRRPLGSKATPDTVRSCWKSRRKVTSFTSITDRVRPAEKAIRPEAGEAAMESIHCPLAVASSTASPSRLHTTLPSSPPVTTPSPEGWTAAHRMAPSWTSLRAPFSNRTEPSPRAKIAPVLSNRAAVTWASKEKVVMSARRQGKKVRRAS